MSPTCPPLEEFAGILSLPAEDPRRAHLEQCPRCRARMTAFNIFMEDGPVPAGARPEEARRRLTEAVRLEAGLKAGRDASTPGSAIRRWITGPVWKPAVGLACAILLILALGRITLRHPDDGPPVYRGTATSAGWNVVCTANPGEDLELRWTPQRGATDYALTLYGPDLKEILHLDARADTHAVVPRDRIHLSGVPASVTIYCRVEAFRNGDRIARSEARPVRLR